MRTHGMILTVGLVLIGACSRSADSRRDEALMNDLALAAQVKPYQAQQFVSPTEQQLGGAAQAPGYTAAARSSQPVYRTSSRRVASRSGNANRSRGSSYPSAPSEPDRNTKRDAAIGAGAGAIIGAVTSRDKVKGGLIGAAAGGILGGIIGHTVDVKRP